MREFAERVQDLEADRPIVCICHHGARSAQVALFLESRGVPDVFNLSGGLDAWAVQVDPGFPRY
jgi:rhodanese-related sulfurtransferase